VLCGVGVYIDSEFSAGADIINKFAIPTGKIQDRSILWYTLIKEAFAQCLPYTIAAC